MSQTLSRLTLAPRLTAHQAAAEDKRLAKERKERERARRANEQAEVRETLWAGSYSIQGPVGVSD